MTSNEVMIKFMTFQNQLRILHWQTKSYARHMAYGNTYEALDSLIDRFIETYMGKMGRITLDAQKSIRLENMSEIRVAEFVDNFCDFLLKFNSKIEGIDEQKDSDLLNIRDEILGLTNKLKYLLTLK